MALNGRKMWGSYANRCRRCSEVYHTNRVNAAYCSAECRREGLAHLRRVWNKAHYMKRKMDPLKLSERLEAVLKLPTIGPTPRLTALNHARRMMAYA